MHANARASWERGGNYVFVATNKKNRKPATAKPTPTNSAFSHPTTRTSVGTNIHLSSPSQSTELELLSFFSSRLLERDPLQKSSNETEKGRKKQHALLLK